MIGPRTPAQERERLCQRRRTIDLRAAGKCLACEDPWTGPPDLCPGCLRAKLDLQKERRRRKRKSPLDGALGQG